MDNNSNVDKEKPSESGQKFDASKTMEQLKNGLMNGWNKAGEAFRNAVKSINDKVNPVEVIEYNAKRDFLKLIYCLIIADKEVTDNEKAEFVSIGAELDPDFNDYYEQDQLRIDELVRENEKDFGYLGSIKVTMGNIIAEIIKQPDVTIQDRKVLLWDILVMAEVGGYKSEEKELVKYAASKVKISETLLSEMVNYYDAIEEINSELEELKKSPRPFNDIYPIFEKLGDRKSVMEEAVAELLKDKEGGM